MKHSPGRIHIKPQNKSHKFKKTKILKKHIFKPQRYETRNQLQGGKWKKNKHMEANNMLLNNQLPLKKSGRKIKNSWRQMKMGNSVPKSMDAAKAVLRRQFIAI